MLFLLILLLATLAAAGVARLRAGDVPLRRSARQGLGIALIAAGISHLVDATPFQQHLPDFVPAAAAIVVVSGVIEIVLGLALIVARSSVRRVGLIAAAFLVGVFPANVYVAVADVEVDGLPGGIYRWIRLPLQAIFVGWAWWSTRTRDVGEAESGSTEIAHHQRFGIIPPVPSTRGSDLGRTGTSTTVQASVLSLRRYRDVPAFMRAALRLRAAFAESPGAIEMSLRAAPLRRTFWTLSHWRSDADIAAFVGHPVHREVMRRFGPALQFSAFVTWNSNDTAAISWDDASTRLAAERRSADELAVGSAT